MKRTLNLGLLAVGLCAAFSAMAREQLADFASQLPLTVTGQGPWYRLELPLAVQLSAHQSDLGDVRVFNAAGEPLAYSLLHELPQHIDNQVQTSVKWFPLYEAADAVDAAPAVRVQLGAHGSLIEVQPEQDLEAGEEILRGWLLDTSAINGPLTQLSIDWNSEREGIQRFSIQGSDDLQHWRSLGDGQVARLSFADERIEQHDVTLPAQPARYLRLLWQSPRSAPVLSAVQVLSSNSTVVPPALVWSEPLKGVALKNSEYSWQLPGPLAVERLKVTLDQPNSLAPVDVFGRNDSKNGWEPLEGGLLYRLTQNGEDDLQDELPMRGETLRQVMMHVDDRGGGLGSEAPTLRVAVRPVQLVFLARGEPPYRLAVGSATVTGAQLPLATLIPDASVPGGRATLAVAAPVIAALPVAAPPASIDWKRIALWAVLVVGVLVLGAMAYSLTRARATRH
ncbi:DUF3999 domain-containing protein [Pseudomonas abieticivorans]|uniref:DUF3999 domain-containing protein n=1 Tax=Pseudomonas abieticivorans TaxID=2931382 RepID=UPI0020BD78EE|nr:DUF3999 domain-containing protein [Pseudomonas sp. PIA16]